MQTDFVDSENTLRIIADIIMIIGSSPDVNDGDDELDRTLWLGILTEFLVNKFQSRYCALLFLLTD